VPFGTLLKKSASLSFNGIGSLGSPGLSGSNGPEAGSTGA